MLHFFIVNIKNYDVYIIIQIVPQHFIIFSNIYFYSIHVLYDYISTYIWIINNIKYFLNS